MKHLLILLMVFVCSFSVAKAEYDPYANLPMPLVTMTKYELVNIFVGNKSHWDNGTRITVVVFGRDDIKQRNFIRNKLGISVAYFYRLYTKNKSGVYYPSFPDQKTAIRVLIDTPGSIGLINDSLYYIEEDKIKKIIIID